MNICVFCHDAYMSGANKSLYDWINSDKEDEFLIILPHVNRGQDFSKLDNVKVISGNYFVLCKELTRRSFIYKAKKAIKILYMSLFGKLAFKNIEVKIIENNIDVIISNSFSVYYGAEIAKNLNISHFWHIREFMELDHQIEHYDQGKISQLASCSNAIFISDVIREYYETKYKFKNVRTIYCQVKIVNKIDLNKDMFKHRKIRVIMSGVLQENKGQKEAIKAINILHNKGYDIYLDIFGDGPQRSELTKLINDANSNRFITLKGFSKELDTIRSNYDIALVCSSNEALGRVTIESMGSGCVTIGANVGCTSFLIKNNVNGFLYKLHNPYDLADKIVYIYENKNEMNKIRLNARQYVEQYFDAPIYMNMIDYINECK